MEQYAAVLNYAIPFFMSLLLIEKIAAWVMKKDVINSMDTLSSLSSGLSNAVKDVLGLTLVIVSYPAFVDNIALIEIKPNWLVYTLAFITLDFAGYWNHRLSHSVNYFWNHHIIHHSSEEFNLACALRQSISNFFTIFGFLMIPAALLGIPTAVVGVIAPLHLFAQYWYHTQLIGKMGILEKIIVTPSHHRVHHAINDEYLDKNMAQIFIIWDHLFGTFQEELADVPPVYGVKRPSRTWNPILINFQHLWLLIKDAWRTKSYWDKIRIWFMPTGWRPADVAQKYNVFSIEDVTQHQKYAPKISTKLRTWVWFQFLVTFVLMMHMFNHFGTIGFPGVLFYGGFLMICIFSYTTMMDQHKMAGATEAIKAIIGLSIIAYSGDWFELNNVLPNGSILVGIYFVLATIVSLILIYKERSVHRIKE